MLDNKISVYIASPYSKGDVAENVRQSIFASDSLAQAGFLPFCPLLTHFWHLVSPHDYEFWMEQDFQWLSRCDILVRLPGESEGADREVEFATNSAGMAVYIYDGDIGELGNWLTSKIYLL